MWIEMFQDIKLLTSERGFKAVRETHKEMMLVAGRRPRDHTHRTMRMNKRIVGPGTSTSDTTCVPAKMLSG